LGQNKDLELKSVVRALDELYLIDLSLDKLSDHPKFVFEFKLIEKVANKASRFVVEYKPKGKQMFKLATQVIQQQQASFKHHLFDQFPLKGDEILQENPYNKEEAEQDGIDLKKLMLAGFKVKKR
jgi:hypothetical protein